ncbi:MAG: Hsp70 family protein [Alphaproteobacteria bacterium]|nr:Hsp70 family protein [Alphaproteobacteria bacterium]
MITCGIDFGTSNSALALAAQGRITLAPVEEGQLTLPSAIFYQPIKNKPLFGRRAQRHFFEGDEGRFMRSLKRLLGTSLMGQGTVVNGKLRKFDTIIGDFIAHLKASAEAAAGETVENVVMGRPVHFIDGDAAGDARAQGELEKIARAVGFKNILFQFEPIAAAFAHERRVRGEKLALVVDIGGGTSDFTVIRLSEERGKKTDRQEDILANTGLRVGGNDFDKDLCLAAFMPDFGYKSTYGEKNLELPLSPFHDMSEWSKVNFLYTPKIRGELHAMHRESHDMKRFGRFVNIVERETGHRLLSVVEDCKISLTAENENTAPLGFVEEGFAIPVTRDGFDAAVEKHVEAIDAAAAECLRQSGVSGEDVGLVILTGGTTEVPLLKSAVAKRFPAAELSEDEKLASVGIGLGYDSLRRFTA